MGVILATAHRPTYQGAARVSVLSCQVVVCYRELASWLLHVPSSAWLITTQVYQRSQTLSLRLSDAYR